jgi:hypothetical protein
MSNEQETIYFPKENLTTVICAFISTFKISPLCYISMDEIISIFEQNFELTEDGEYQLLVSDLTKFFSEKISGLYVERLMVDMDKKGLATLGHDGTDIVLIKKKDIDF